MENADFEIYKGKTFPMLCKDIVKNSEDKKNQVDILITDLRGLIKTTQDAMTVVPLLKEYYDVGIRNDEQLIKLAAIIARIMAGGPGGEEGSTLLTEEEKKQLMAAVEETAKKISETNGETAAKVEEVKAK